MSSRPEPPAPTDVVDTAPTGDLLDSPSAGPAALRGSALRSAGYVAGLLLTLASAPLLIRHLGQERFGRYVTITSIATVVMGLTEGGLNTIVLRELVTLKGAERKRMLSDALGLRLVLSAVAVALAVAFTAVGGYGGTLVLGALLAGAGILLQAAASFLGVGLQGSLRFGWVTTVDLARQVTNVCLIVALVLAGAGVLSFLAVSIPASAVALGFTAVLVRGLMPLRPAFHPRAWWPLLRDTIPFAIAIALYTVYFRVTVIVMSLSASALQTGYFSTSFRVIEVMIGVPALVIGAGFPILARAASGDRDRFARATERLFELAVLAGALTSVAIGLGARFAVDVLGGHDALPAAPVLRIQGLAMVATWVAVACGYPLLSLRRNRELLIANIAALVASVAGTLALVPVLQARGAAIAAVGAELALAATTAWLLVRADRTLRLPLSILPVALVASAAGVGAGLAVGVHAVVEVIVASIVFVAVVAAFGRFPPEVRDALPAGRRR